MVSFSETCRWTWVYAPVGTDLLVMQIRCFPNFIKQSLGEDQNVSDFNASSSGLVFLLSPLITLGSAINV